jgi:hypothetical protein
MKKIILVKYILPFNVGRYLWLLVFLCLFLNNVQSQNATPASASTSEAVKPIKNTFDDIILIDNQTVEANQKNMFEFVLEHRFGAPISTGYSDMFGLFTSANMALKVYYSPLNTLNLGIGINEENKTWEGNLKWALMRQSETGGWPVSISYFGNFAIDGRQTAGNFVNSSDRFSYFNQLMIARKFSDFFSIQAGLSLSYFNNIPGYLDSSGNVQPKMNNAHYAMEFLGRFKLTETTSIVVDYDQPLTTHPMDNPKCNIAAGFDFEIKGHSFELFLTNYGYTLPQNNNFFNQNDYTKGNWVFGFNITRKWQF